MASVRPRCVASFRPRLPRRVDLSLPALAALVHAGHVAEPRKVLGRIEYETLARQRVATGSAALLRVKIDERQADAERIDRIRSDAHFRHRKMHFGEYHHARQGRELRCGKCDSCEPACFHAAGACSVSNTQSA
eukprot:6184568-Pleurochrysis_carterae.AAC.2